MTRSNIRLRWLLMPVVALALCGCKDLKIHTNTKNQRYGKPLQLWMTYDGDALPSSADVQWISDKDGRFARGGNVVIHSLSPGKHKITAIGRYKGESATKGPITITIKNDRPQARISRPGHNSSFGVGDQIVFLGSGTDREDGTLPASSLSWSSNTNGSLGTGRRASVDDFRPGTHRVTLTACDRAGATHARYVDVTIRNRAPDVVIDQPASSITLRAGQTLSLRGHANDPDPLRGSRVISSDKLIWSSDKQGRLGSGSTLSVADLQGGQHRITLKARDEFNKVGEASVQVSVTNRLPTVRITRPSNHGNYSVQDTISFRASVRDPDGFTITDSNITWRSNRDGVIGNGRSFSSDRLTPGTHSITAAAQDQHGGVATSRAIELIVDNGRPVATITGPATGSSFNFGETFVLSGTGSDPDDGILSGRSLVWSVRTEGSTQRRRLGTGSRLRTSLGFGTHRVYLHAYDADRTPSTGASIQVVVRNNGPNVTISSPADGFTVPAGQKIVLTGSAFDPDRNTWLQDRFLSWACCLTNGGPVIQLGNGRRVETRRLTAGSWFVDLTATDPDDSTITRKKRITVHVSAAPVATITSPRNNARFGFKDSFVAEGRGTDAEDGNLPGSSLSWSVKKANGTTRNLGTGSRIRVGRLGFGTHELSLRATDSSGATSRVTKVKVVVNNVRPRVTITSPTANTIHVPGTQLVLTGNGFDPDRDTWLGDDKLRWTARLSTGGSTRTLGTGRRAVVNNLGAGSWTITLTATDPDDSNLKSTANVRINGNQKPVASITSPQNNARFQAGQSFYARGTATDPEDGALASQRLQWSILGVREPGSPRSLGRGNRVRVANLQPGAYWLYLEGTDSNGTQGDATRIRIRIGNGQPTPPTPPVTPVRPPRVNITSPQTGTTHLTTADIQFTGRARDLNRNRPIRGSLLKWTAAKVGGTTRNLGNGRSIKAKLPTGVYQVTLTATDPHNANNKASKTVRIVVKRPTVGVTGRVRGRVRIRVRTP